MTALARRTWPVVSLAAGPAIFVLLATLAPDSLSGPARLVLGLAGWMAVWWLSEPVPLAATSLLPIAVLPLTGAVSARDAAAPYASEIVFLFLAGFLLAAALETWNAHTRVAYALIAAIGTGPRRVILAVMIATGAISMWISNTATAAMMYPLAIAVGALFGTGGQADRARTGLMLGVAYAASIGGMGTLIGTPPNMILAGSAAELTGRAIGFGEFMAIGVPLVVVLLPLTWALLVFVLHRADLPHDAKAAEAIAQRRAGLGPMAQGERRTLVLFGAVAAAWVLRERKVFGGVTVPGLVDLAPGLADSTIGIIGAILLFIITARTAAGGRRPLLAWEEARRIPWDVLLLFGGGLSLAAAMESTGVARWTGEHLAGLAGAPTIVVYAGLAAVVILLSELASNTAVAAMMMPLAAALGTAVGEPPLAMMLVAGLAASVGFALPVATPPNTILFGSGQIGVRDMARAGVLLDALALIAIVVAVRLLFPALFG